MSSVIMFGNHAWDTFLTLFLFCFWPWGKLSSDHSASSIWQCFWKKQLSHINSGSFYFLLKLTKSSFLWPLASLECTYLCSCYVMNPRKWPWWRKWDIATNKMKLFHEFSFSESFLACRSSSFLAQETLVGSSAMKNMK